MKNLVKAPASLDGRVVTYAQLHEATIFTPKGGQIKSPLTSSKTPMTKDTKMTINGQFVVVEHTDKGGNVEEILVPVSAFKVLVLERN